MVRSIFTYECCNFNLIRIGYIAMRKFGWNGQKALVFVNTIFIVPKQLKVLLKYLMKCKCCGKNVSYFMKMFTRSPKFFKVEMVDVKEHMNFGSIFMCTYVSETLFSSFFSLQNKMIVQFQFALHYYYWYSSIRIKTIELNWTVWENSIQSFFLFKIHQTSETFQIKV